jgi:ribosome-dependent ATPase
MFVMGYGISMDVEDLSYAVLDRDQTSAQPRLRAEPLRLALFCRAPAMPTTPISTGACAAANCRWPSKFRPALRATCSAAPVQIGAWIDGAMPQRAETVQGYVQGMHQHWLVEIQAAGSGIGSPRLANVETRFRYNPDVKSLPAMVPAVIPCCCSCCRPC